MHLLTPPLPSSNSIHRETPRGESSRWLVEIIGVTDPTCNLKKGDRISPEHVSEPSKFLPAPCKALAELNLDGNFGGRERTRRIPCLTGESHLRRIRNLASTSAGCAAIFEDACAVIKIGTSILMAPFSVIRRSPGEQAGTTSQACRCRVRLRCV